MGLITDPNDLTTPANKLAKAADVEAKIDVIISEVNGNLENVNIKAGANINQSKILDLVTDLAARLLKAGDTMTGGLLFKFASPYFRLIGTEGSAKDWRVIENAGTVKFEENTGTEASPTWTTRYTLPAGAGGPATGTDLATKTYVDTLTAAAVTVLNKTASNITVTNTVTETTVYSFSVPGGTLSTNNRLRLTLLGTIVRAGSPNTGTFRVKYGGTTVAAPAIAIDATTRAMKFEAIVSGDDAANAQHGFGMIAATAHAVAGDRGTAAVDSTSAQTLAVTFQWGLAEAGATMVIEHAVLEKLP